MYFYNRDHLLEKICLFFLFTFLDNATIGVEQNKPIFTPGVANFDEFDAMAKSQLATN